MQNLDRSMSERHQQPVIPFEEFLGILTRHPASVLRNVFQVFYDMMTSCVIEKKDELPDDPESRPFVNYDCTPLFVEDTDNPFFADRLFANRLMKHVEAMKRGAQQNKIYIFDGPPGCGKSTFLNNLLLKFEEYTKTPRGLRYEAVWRLDRKQLSVLTDLEADVADHIGWPSAADGHAMLENASEADMAPDFLQGGGQRLEDHLLAHLTDDYIEIPCPSHDHPILMVPKHYRRKFFEDLFPNDAFKSKLFMDKEYDWVFRQQPCTICNSIYWALLNRLNSPKEVFSMLYARPYQFNRRLGEGISVFNPGDSPMRQSIMGNPILQHRINRLLRDSNQVRYVFSQYAKTNNGIYALMDIKSHNIDRLIKLHNIISEGIHKVENIEENVHCLLIALMNPEDKKNIQDFQSFSDRIAYVNIPYVLDLNTEVDIYRNIFGQQLDKAFLPRVLHNFARVIISSRLEPRSAALLEWIGDPKKYQLYCDANLLLLKMEIYTGHIPSWLSEEDRKRFTGKLRRRILAESEAEGKKGFSGRDAIKIFNEFFSKFAKDGKLINMSELCTFFTKTRKDLAGSVPADFLTSLQDMYDYTVLQEVKESLYDYNEAQISRDLQNYLFAVNFEIGSEEACQYTGDRLHITEKFFEDIEKRLLSAGQDKTARQAFRMETQKKYATRTLPQEIMIEGRLLKDTQLYQTLHERYVYHLKEKVLDPFIENEHFRHAVKDYGEVEFKSYDKHIKEEVTFLMNNLCNNIHYTPQGAKEICIYVIDNNLVKKFAKT